MNVVKGILIGSFTIGAIAASAQQDLFRSRISVMGGIDRYVGDITQSYSDVVFENSSMIGLNYQRSMSYGTALYGQYSFIRLSGNDLVDGNRERALNFLTEAHTFELGLNFRMDNGRLLKYDARFAPFFSIGAGVGTYSVSGDLYSAGGSRYHYWSDGTIRDLSESSPFAFAADEISQDGNYETDLTNLRTENGKPKDPYYFYIPAKLGLKWRICDRISAEAFYGFNWTFTDFLDDIHDTYPTDITDPVLQYMSNPTGSDKQRGNPNNNDHYHYAGLSLSWSFGRRSHEYRVIPVYIDHPSVPQAMVKDSVLPPPPPPKPVKKEEPKVVNIIVGQITVGKLVVDTLVVGTLVQASGSGTQKADNVGSLAPDSLKRSVARAKVDTVVGIAPRIDTTRIAPPKVVQDPWAVTPIDSSLQVGKAIVIDSTLVTPKPAKADSTLKNVVGRNDPIPVSLDTLVVIPADTLLLPKVLQPTTVILKDSIPKVVPAKIDTVRVTTVPPVTPADTLILPKVSQPTTNIPKDSIPKVVPAKIDTVQVPKVTPILTTPAKADTIRINGTKPVTLPVPPAPTKVDTIKVAPPVVPVITPPTKVDTIMVAPPVVPIVTPQTKVDTIKVAPKVVPAKPVVPTQPQGSVQPKNTTTVPPTQPQTVIIEAPAPAQTEPADRVVTVRAPVSVPGNTTARDEARIYALKDSLQALEKRNARLQFLADSLAKKAPAGTPGPVTAPIESGLLSDTIYRKHSQALNAVMVDRINTLERYIELQNEQGNDSIVESLRSRIVQLDNNVEMLRDSLKVSKERIKTSGIRSEPEIKGAVAPAKTPTNNKGTMTAMADTVYFASNSYAINTTNSDRIKGLGNMIRASQYGHVVVSGHSDQAGDASYNLRLSQFRAEEVAKILVQGGVPPDRIVTKGLGEKLSRMPHSDQERNVVIQVVFTEK